MMFLKYLMAAAFSLAICGSVSAQVATDPKFDGVMDILTATAQCAAAGPVATAATPLTASYRARVTQGKPNSANSALSFRSSFSYHIIRANVATSKLNGAGTYTGAKIHGNVDFVTGFQGTYSFTVTPSSPVLTTKFVTIEGSITNYTGLAGCTVTVRAALSRRP
jgi:hypothetical protein